MVPRRFHKYLEVFEKKGVRKNANKEVMGLYHRSQKGISYKKGKDISIIKNRERESTGVLEGLVL